MTKMRKAGFATAAAGATLATVVLPSAFAGTGGSDNAGILYGEDAAYCDAQGGTLLKTDSLSEQVLEGAVFSITNPGAPSALGSIGVKYYTDDPAASITADRITWQEAFDTNLSDTFTADPYGTAWLAASVRTTDATTPGANSDTDSTEYNATEIAYFPADITGLTNASAQSAAMTGWPTMPAPATGVVTVSEFFTNLKNRLDAEGAVVLENYDATAPVAAVAGGNTATELRGTDSEAAALAEYNKALTEFNRLRAALVAAGYTNVTWSAVNAPTFGAVNTTVQDFAAFTAAYDAMTAAGAYPFGLVPPTYDVIYNVVGTPGVVAAEAAANTAVGATALADGASTTATTNANGEVNYAVFGRTVTEVGATMDRSCGHLGLVVTETTAPAGYNIDDPAPRVITPASLEGAVTDNEWTDTLTSTPVDPEVPVPPVFESGASLG